MHQTLSCKPWLSLNLCEASCKLQVLHGMRKLHAQVAGLDERLIAAEHQPHLPAKDGDPEPASASYASSVRSSEVASPRADAPSLTAQVGQLSDRLAGLEETIADVRASVGTADAGTAAVLALHADVEQLKQGMRELCAQAHEPAGVPELQVELLQLSRRLDTAEVNTAAASTARAPEDVEAVAQNIAALKQEMMRLAEAVQLCQATAADDGALSALAERVASTEAALAANSQQSRETHIDGQLQQSMDAVQAGLAELQMKVDTIAEDLAGIQIEAISTSTSLQEALQSHSAMLSELNSRVRNLPEADSSTAREAVDGSVGAQVVEISARIDALQQAVNASTGHLPAMQVAIQEAAAAVNDLQGSYQHVSSRVQALESTRTGQTGEGHADFVTQQVFQALAIELEGLAAATSADSANQMHKLSDAVASLESHVAGHDGALQGLEDEVQDVLLRLRERNASENVQPATDPGGLASTEASHAQAAHAQQAAMAAEDLAKTAHEDLHCLQSSLSALQEEHKQHVAAADAEHGALTVRVVALESAPIWSSADSFALRLSALEGSLEQVQQSVAASGNAAADVDGYSNVSNRVDVMAALLDDLQQDRGHANSAGGQRIAAVEAHMSQLQHSLQAITAKHDTSSVATGAGQAQHPENIEVGFPSHLAGLACFV
jgi:chromosome segregation ATPase